jgi:hypothetical protein
VADEGGGMQSLPEGHARVCWLGKEEIDTDSPFGELQVVDRAFLHGDIVAKASNPLGQVCSRLTHPESSGEQQADAHTSTPSLAGRKPHP